MSRNLVRVFTIFMASYVFLQRVQVIQVKIIKNLKNHTLFAIVGDDLTNL